MIIVRQTHRINEPKAPLQGLCCRKIYSPNNLNLLRKKLPLAQILHLKNLM